MNVHVSTVRRNGKTYRYTQLVQSFRRDDGVSTQRVLANLGRLGDVEIENLRAALKASRSGERVVVASGLLTSKVRFVKPTENLRYLDVAVLHELWRELGLHELLDELLPRGEAQVAPSDVVEALAVQRCVDPGSKLYAERWFPTTALPELLGVDPANFNNTRLHRVLHELDAGTSTLMERLPALYRSGRQRDFVALYLDVTDAQFAGQGPALAARAKTKQGVVQRKIGIVLLCNEHGYPLRWKVVGGRCAENLVMHEVLEDVRRLSWVGSTPLVCDRSMGSSADIGKMLRADVCFVTALRASEYAAYADIPHRCLADLRPACRQDEASNTCVIEAGKRVEQAGMRHVSPTLYVLDLGVVERDAPRESDSARSIKTSLSTHNDARGAMQCVRAVETMVAEGEADSFRGAARRLGLTFHRARAYRRLTKLDVDIQQVVLDGKAPGITIGQLRTLAGISDPTEQRSQFDQLLSAAASQPRPEGKKQSLQKPRERTRLRVRAALSFNPERFVDERRRAYKLLDEIQAEVSALNKRLAKPRNALTKRGIENKLDRVLRRRSVLDLYRIEVAEHATADGRAQYEAKLELELDVWQRRRRYDGFGLIVAHPDIELSATELCRLYRAKDTVEKDFQVIKSLVRLRPIWHHTDAKVRAHVTVCMLALLLERTLHHRLEESSAELALETLRNCCLNRFEDAAGKSGYVVTQPNPEQRRLLKELKLDALTNDDDVVARLRPR